MPLVSAEMEALDHDVVVLGAGISGIDAAWHLKHKCPTHSFVVLESKQEIGGTWSLFKYCMGQQSVLCRNFLPRPSPRRRDSRTARPE